MLAGLLLTACTPAATPQPDQLELARVSCESLGGSAATPANAADPASLKCSFPDGSVCDGLELLNGNCPQVNPAANQPQASATPYPTKDQSPPTTPVVKDTDPYPGWATYTNSDYSFAFRYPDSWQVTDDPNLALLTQPGIELRIYFSGFDENMSFPVELPYHGNSQTGQTFDFFSQTYQETQVLVDGQVLAVIYGPQGMPGGDREFTIYMSSLQSNQPLPGARLAEMPALLGSFEDWNN
jgi:putative hemolysin